MTMTEGSIELAGATGVDAIVAHHPIAEAANSGGVILKNYLDLYNVAAFELHEAFHGLHPGIPFCTAIRYTGQRFLMEAYTEIFYMQGKYSLM